MNGDLPIFPVLDNGQAWLRTGLTKREYFAGLAMQGLIVKYRDHQCKHDAGEPPCDLVNEIAFGAVDYADALIAELAK